MHSFSRVASRPSCSPSADLPLPCAELFVTEASHLRILRVLDLVFYQRLRKENLLSREELALLFPNLPDLIEIHSKASWGGGGWRGRAPSVFLAAWLGWGPMALLQDFFPCGRGRGLLVHAGNAPCLPPSLPHPNDPQSRDTDGPGGRGGGLMH